MLKIAAIGGQVPLVEKEGGSIVMRAAIAFLLFFAKRAIIDPGARWYPSKTMAPCMTTIKWYSKDSPAPNAAPTTTCFFPLSLYIYMYILTVCLCVRILYSTGCP